MWELLKLSQAAACHFRTFTEWPLLHAVLA